MFCFHCGADLIETDGVLRCQATGMELSQRLQRGLTTVFVDRVRDPERRPAGMITLRHPYFCPGCGLQMTPDGCPRCDGVLDEFAHDILELHPHKRTTH